MALERAAGSRRGGGTERRLDEPASEGRREGGILALAIDRHDQNQILPRLELERQQVEQMRQRKQIGGLTNQVQQIQRGTGMRQIDETIRPTGHASTFQNLSHFYPQR